MADVKPSDAVRRVVVTVLAGAVFLVLSRVRVFGVADPVFAGLGDLHGDALVPTLLGAGLTPFMTSFLLVEFVAFVVPPLREARVTDGRGRARLDRFAWGLGVVFLLVQLLAITRFTQSALGSSVPFGLVFAQLLVAHGVMLGLLWLVTRQGLGHGFALFVALGLASVLVEVLGNMWNSLATEVISPAAALLVTVLVGGVAGMGVRWARRAAAERGALPVSAPFPVTTTGVLSVAGAWLSLPATLAAWVPAAGSVQQALMGSALLYQALLLVLSVGLALLVGVFAFRPLLVGMMWAQWNPEVVATDATEAARKVLPRALRDGLVFTVALPIVVMLVSQQFGVPVGAMTAMAALGLGCAWADLLEEWRALRRNGSMVRVLRVQRTAEVAAVLQRLASVGIEAHARSWRFRATQQFFGPWLPVEIMVPVARVEEARKALGLSSPRPG